MILLLLDDVPNKKPKTDSRLDQPNELKKNENRMETKTQQTQNKWCVKKGERVLKPWASWAAI